MYMRYFLDANGKRIYTFNVIIKLINIKKTLKSEENPKTLLYYL